MKRSLSALAATCAAALAVAVATLPAGAQYSTEYSPAKLIKQGTTTKPIAGSGTVIVQVDVKPDGTHQAMRVIKSTNAGDNDAAMDIAQNSTYRPAHQGSKPIRAFYDFTLKFNGKSVASSVEGETSAAAQVEALIRAGNYAAAKTKAQSLLLSNPNDDSLRQMYGIAAADAGDMATAAAAFDKVSAIGVKFKPIAAASFAAASVQIADSNPTLALAYAQKAVALSPDTTSKFALGVAQLANKQNAEALATLKAVHDAAMNDPKFNAKAKVNVDARLMSAYLANNDAADAQTIANEIKQLDPSSSVAGLIMGNTYLKMAVAAQDAKNNADALKYFKLAAEQPNADVAVTANVSAAFLVSKTDKPDYKQMQAFADAALALKPDSPEANFAEGIALTGQWAQTHDDGLKKKALDALNKADSLAKAAGNEALALNIESFIKNQLSGSAGGGQ